MEKVHMGVGNGVNGDKEVGIITYKKVRMKGIQAIEDREVRTSDTNQKHFGRGRATSVLGYSKKLEYR